VHPVSPYGYASKDGAVNRFQLEHKFVMFGYSWMLSFGRQSSGQYVDGLAVDSGHSLDVQVRSTPHHPVQSLLTVIVRLVHIVTQDVGY